MVFVQLFAFGRVSNNRVRRKSARAAVKAEQEKKGSSAMGGVKKKRASSSGLIMNGQLAGHDGAEEFTSDGTSGSRMTRPSTLKHPFVTFPNGLPKEDSPDSNESTQETSEEETII